MLNNKKMAKPIKSFCRVQGRFFQKEPLAAGGKLLGRQWICFLLFLSFFIPGIINASGQYRVLSWKGDVKIRKGGKFISLTGQAKISLEKGDGLWLANGAEVELRFPGGNQKVVYGPRFTKVETLEKARKGPSILVNLIKSIGIEELLSRKQDSALGTTKSGSYSLHEKIKNAILEMEEPSLATGKEKEMNKMLALVEDRFDAAPMEKQVLIKARVYKHFNRHKLALMTVFNYYEKILDLEGKKMERDFIEDFLFDEFLPIVIKFNLEDPDFITFSSNFKLWWAAFSFDGKELKEIEKTIDNRLHLQENFKINPGITSKEKSKFHYFFIIACSDWMELEKLDDLEEAKKELLGKEIPVESSGKVVGLGKVIIKIGLKSEG